MRPGDARCRGRGPASAEYSGQKKRGPKAPPVLQCRERSEALDVTHVRRTAVGVVQVEVERTAVVADQFRHLVGHVVDAERELRVPRQFHAGLQVMCEVAVRGARTFSSEEHTSELQSLMRHSYAVFCL